MNTPSPAIANRAWAKVSALIDEAHELRRSDPIASLGHLGAVERQLGPVLIASVVATARKQGATWEEIANAFGLKDRQTAQQRWGKPDRSRSV